jgi:hypothetical protein
VQVNDFEIRQALQILDFFDLVPREDEYLQRLDSRMGRDLFELVPGQVQERKVREAHDVFNLGDGIVAEIKELELVFALKQGHAAEASVVKLDLLAVLQSFERSPVDHHDSWDLLEFYVDCPILLLNVVDDAILHKVTVALVLLLCQQLRD